MSKTEKGKPIEIFPFLRILLDCELSNDGNISCFFCVTEFQTVEVNTVC